MPDILSTAKAAEYLGLAAATLNRYRVTGEGPRYAKLGGKSGTVRYRKADLEAWLESRLISSTSEAI